VQIASGVRLEARQREAPVSQILSSKTDPSNVGATSLSKDATGNKLPVPLPQEIAVQRPRIPQVAALIARLTRPNHSLITAVEECDMLKMCEILYDQRKVVWLDSESFCMAIVWAAGKGEEQAVRLLIEKGADVNGCDAFGSSALHLASENGHEQVVRLLIENGADVNARDATYEKSPLHYASKYGHEQVVRLLIEKRADINAHDADRKTAVHLASQNGHKQVVQLLIEKGADVNACNAYKRSTLHYASENGHKEVVQLLQAHHKQNLRRG
jgi:ankyrin repeat protein